MDQKPIYVMVHASNIENSRDANRKTLESNLDGVPVWKRVCERTLDASMEVIKEIRLLRERGEETYFIEGSPDEVMTERLDIERPILVGGAFYSKTGDLPLCVNAQISALKKAGYDAQVHPPTTFTAYGDVKEQLSALLSDPSIKPIYLYSGHPD